MDIEWKKNEPESTAVIKRKIFLTILEFNILTSESFFSHFYVGGKMKILGRKSSRTSSKGQVTYSDKHFGAIKAMHGNHILVGRFTQDV